MALEMSLNFTLVLGAAKKEMRFVPLPGNPLGGFIYFNMNEEGMSQFVDEGARLIAEEVGEPENTVLFTAETSTLAIAHVLRTKYGFEVQVMTKRPRPDGRVCVSVDYCAVTSTKSSSLYFDYDYDTEKKVVFFDNVCTTGETIKAAQQVLLKLKNQKHLALCGAIVLFTEGEKVSRIGDVPVISFGHLPIVDLSLSQTRRQYELKAATPLPTYDYGNVTMWAFENRTGKTVIVASNDLEKFGGVDVPVRVHDACMTSEVWMSQKCDCREQLQMAMKFIAENGGMVIYLPNEGRGIGLANKFLVYEAQETQGLDTVDANRFFGFPDDIREYLAVRDILEHFGIKSIDLMTNNPMKIEKLEELGVRVNKRLPCVVSTQSEYCLRYMRAKVDRMKHIIPDNSPIRFYEPDEENGFLSNFFLTELKLNDRLYNSVEHFYQSMKFSDHPEIEAEVRDAESPHLAFQVSRKYAKYVREDWMRKRVEFMKVALVEKFKDGELLQKLITTGDSNLIEDSPVDSYWGMALDKQGQPGENMMGKLLMEVRDACRGRNS